VPHDRAQPARAREDPRDQPARSRLARAPPPRDRDPAHHRALRLRVRVGRPRLVLRAARRARRRRGGRHRARRSRPPDVGGGRAGADPAPPPAAGPRVVWWWEAERTRIRLADELHDDARISEALWAELRRHWSDDQLV